MEKKQNAGRRLSANDSETETLVGDPLERLQLEINKKGKVKTVPALHLGWAEDVPFVKYKPPPVPTGKDGYSSEDRVIRDQWLERMDYIQADLHWLLRLPHQRFWSQVAFHLPLHETLDSFLKNAPRAFDLHDMLVTEEMRSIHEQVERSVFMVYLRMATFKESKTTHITPQFFGEMIYNYFLFDILKIMDLCVIYGESNKVLLNKMISNIFSNQPKYHNDLHNACVSLTTTLDTIEAQLGMREPETATTRGVNEKLISLERMTWHQLQDVMLYLVDTCCTINAFLDVYPPASEAFHLVGFAPRLSMFYETVVPPLLKELKIRSQGDTDQILVEEMEKRLHLARSAMLKIFRSIVETCCINPMLDTSHISGGSQYTEDFLQVMTAIISERRFTFDYEMRYPFEADLSLVNQLPSPPDATRTQYITDGIESTFLSFGQSLPSFYTETHKEDDTLVARSMDSLSLGAPVENGLSDHYPNGELAGATASPDITGVQLESLISQIRDFLPELGDGFLAACLEYYNYKVDQVLNAVLEENLPPSLSQLDRKLSRKPVEISRLAPQVTLEESVLDSRHNIFDNDEFDVFRNPVIDRTKVHKGKKVAVANPKVVLDENQLLLPHVKELYDRYGSVDDDEDVYNDEYDDTYDGHPVGAEEPTPMDELLARRPFVTPRILRTRDEESASDEQGDSDEGPSQPQPHQLYMDPAVLRERAEQRRRTRQEQRGGQHRPPRDVRGRPGGRGQETDVVKGRTDKDRHKGQRANHNRRDMADRKRGRSFPV